MSSFIIKEELSFNNPSGAMAAPHTQQKALEESHTNQAPYEYAIKPIELDLRQFRGEYGREDPILGMLPQKIARSDSGSGANGEGLYCTAIYNSNYYKPTEKVAKKTPRHYKPRAKKDGTTAPKVPKPRKTLTAEERRAKKVAKAQKELLEEVEKNLKRKGNAYQVSLLEKLFEINSNPGHDIKEAMSKSSGINFRQVQIWFQNRRAKLRRDIATLVENSSQEYINTLLDLPEGMHVLETVNSDVPTPQKWVHTRTEAEEKFLSLMKRPQTEVSKKKEELAKYCLTPFLSSEDTDPVSLMLSHQPETHLSKTSLHTMVNQAQNNSILCEITPIEIAVNVKGGGNRNELKNK